MSTGSRLYIVMGVAALWYIVGLAIVSDRKSPDSVRNAGMLTSLFCFCFMVWGALIA